MTRAVFPHVPDPADARPLQSPTADEIARIRAALPTGTPIMKGKWESMETAPRDGRPVWARLNQGPLLTKYPRWCFCAGGWDRGSDWREPSGDVIADVNEWFNPEATP